MNYQRCVSGDEPRQEHLADGAYQSDYDGVISNQVSALVGAVHRLSFDLEEHYKRLKPVLADVRVDTLKDTQRPTYSIPLAETLCAIVEAIDRQIAGLADVTRRVAL